MVNVVPPQEAGRLVPVVHAELASGAVAIGVHRRLRHPQLSSDLLRAQVLIDEAQAFAFALRQQLDGARHGVGPCGHGETSKRRLFRSVYLYGRINDVRVDLSRL
jgi:hypothetical protein